MRQPSEPDRSPASSIKETPRMPKHPAFLLALLFLAAVSALAPMSAVAAPAPWLQVQTGSLPTNQWIPEDFEEEIATEVGEEFGYKGVAQEILVNGKAVGCLATAGEVGSLFCPFFTGFPPTSTAAELETLLEGVYGTSAVEVTGGPVEGEPFKVVRPRGALPPVTNDSNHSYMGRLTWSVLKEGGSGHLLLTIPNLGDDDLDATQTPLTIVDELPEGVVATRAEGALLGFQKQEGSADCSVEDADLVTCTFEGKLPPYEAIEVDVWTSLTGEPPVAGAPGRVTVSGANAPSVQAAQKVNVSPDPAAFGFEDFSARAEAEGGETDAQAGDHPFQLTTAVALNSKRIRPPRPEQDVVHHLLAVEDPTMARNLRFPLPAGLVGNATAVPRCDTSSFLKGSGIYCPAESAIGVASTRMVLIGLGIARQQSPVFNLPPSRGEPARFGFIAEQAPIVIDTSVDPDDHYRIVAEVRNTSQAVDLLASNLTLWGNPGDPRHDHSRGIACLRSDLGYPCERPSGLSEVAFLRQPVSCKGPLRTDAEAEPWNVPVGSLIDTTSFESEALHGCNRVPFNPSVSSVPTSKLAANSSGLDFELTMPNSGLLNPEAIAEGQAKKVEVALPEGVTINPSEGEGLVGCSPAQYAAETASSAPGAGCPDASKIGTVQTTTPLLEEEATGSLYIASPRDNPFGSLLGLYLVAKIPERGIVIKQAGKVEPDPETGQLVTTFDDLPQLPFSSFHLHFREGGRAPLVTPSACGIYETVARFTPWSASDPENPQPDEVVVRSAAFQIDRGVDGGACPAGGTPPFHPRLTAGTVNNAAGTYSPFDLRLTRSDGEQEFTTFSVNLPRGLIGKLAGIPICSTEAIASAKARTGPTGGQEELDKPSCPIGSEIGSLLVGAGVGSSLTFVPGKLYLAGPYNGAKLSVVAITPAKVGPFDLGNVVIREALKVDPETAEVSVDQAKSDPIPHILQGIPIRARDIRVYLDRPDFVLNPTSCAEKKIGSTVIGSGLDSGSSADDSRVDVSTRFQAADCARLGFKPKLSLRLKGGTRRGAHPRLKAVLKARKGDANIGAAVVKLPHSEFLEQAHIRTICTRVQFAAGNGNGNGSQCPKGSIYGRAKAVSPLLDEPLVGRVYLRSSNHPLPDLVAALHSKKVDINLDGRIDAVNGGIRNSFEAVPDAPVTKFVLEMQGGKKGLLVNSTNICQGKHRAKASFTGQNGKLHVINPLLKARCDGKHKRRSKH
jgi:hypothetical protein